jgi:hypothetical protein
MGAIIHAAVMAHDTSEVSFISKNKFQVKNTAIYCSQKPVTKMHSFL